MSFHTTRRGLSSKERGGPVIRLKNLFKYTLQKLSDQPDTGRRTENLQYVLVLEADAHWYYWPTGGWFPFPRGPVTIL